MDKVNLSYDKNQNNPPDNLVQVLGVVRKIEKYLGQIAHYYIPTNKIPVKTIENQVQETDSLEKVREKKGKEIKKINITRVSNVPLHFFKKYLDICKSSSFD